MQVEKKFYDNLAIHWEMQGKLKGLSESEIKESTPPKPFEERQIEGETDYQYWMRTLNVILDTNGTQEEILKHPNKTYPAYRWSGVIMAGYLAFWDSEFKHDEFVITDIGMTGPKKSVIGMDVDASVKRFETTLPEKYIIATGECIFNGVIFDIDDNTNKVKEIKRIIP